MDGGLDLEVRLTETWEIDVIPSDWSRSLTVLVYKKGQESSCANYRSRFY